MTRWLTILFACLPLMAQGDSGKGDIFPYKLYQEKLDNGLQVVTVPFDSPGLVSFFVLVRVGSRDEVEPGKTGFAHFFEHCMFRGTERFSPSGYDEVLQELAAAGNADTWYDRTNYYFTGNAQRLETMFDIESDRFRYLKYPEHGFKTEAGAVLGEYTKNFASPYRRFSERLQSLAFKKHTYGHTTMGYLEDVKDMPNQYAYSLEFYDHFYRPEYCTVLVVGDVSHDAVMKYSKKYFGDWERGSYVPEIPVEPAQTAEINGHLQVPGDTTLLGVYFKGPAFSETHPDKLALDLFLELGFSNRSDIYRRLVREEQKVRRISGGGADTRDPYILGVRASLFNVEDTAYVRDQIKKTIAEMKAQPIDEQQLANLKSRMRYQTAASFTTPLNVGDQLVQFIWLTGDPQSLNRYYAMLDKITAADVKRAADRYLVEEGRIVLTLSSEEKGR